MKTPIFLELGDVPSWCVDLEIRKIRSMKNKENKR